MVGRDRARSWTGPLLVALAVALLWPEPGLRREGGHQASRSTQVGYEDSPAAQPTCPAGRPAFAGDDEGLCLPSAAPIPEPLIVRFVDYLMAEEHEARLAASLRSLGGGPKGAPGLAWRWVPRSNPAMVYPTDFGLVTFPQTLGSVGYGKAIARLRALPYVRGVDPDRKLTRRLREVSEDVELPGSEAYPGGVASGWEAGALAGKPPGRLRTRFSWTEDGAPAEGGSPTSNGTDDGREAATAELRRRRLAGSGSRPPGGSLPARLGAGALWSRGVRGKGVRMGVFDTGIRAAHPHVRSICERTNWTHEPTLEDGLGHGSFVAGVIAGSDPACPGIAPEVCLHTFRVFTNDQVSYTSWFLDAFNYAIATEMHVVNLSVGGPDYLDRPFVDKVAEVTSSGIIMLSAIGNDGPAWGTLNNPADQGDVIGVGGIDYSDQLAPFSSRGMTTWELPHGHGRPKPDVVAYGRNVMGSAIASGCRPLSGTSVAAPVAAGVVCLLASSIPEEGVALPAAKAAKPARGLRASEGGAGGGGDAAEGAASESAAAERAASESAAAARRVGSRAASAASAGPGPDPSRSRWALLNPASMKQALVESADRLPGLSIFEQGAGKVNIEGAATVLASYIPRASLFPATLDLDSCPYFWPYCEQPLYAGAMAVVVNATILNGMGLVGHVTGGPTFEPTNELGSLLDVSFDVAETLWPWSGHLALMLRVHDSDRGRSADGVAEGTVRFTVSSRPPFGGRQGAAGAASPGDATERVSEVAVPLRARIVPTPERSKRVLLDTGHSIRYPPAYIPRDDLAVRTDVLDWHGDHPSTNFRGLFQRLRALGLYVEVLDAPLTCFDADKYGALLIVDPEDEWASEEVDKLTRDVSERGLGLVVLADWYDLPTMRRLRFYDDNTRSWWEAATGGSNVPALNDLLRPFGTSFAARTPIAGTAALWAPAAALSEPDGSPSDLQALSNPWSVGSATSLATLPPGATLVGLSFAPEGETLARPDAAGGRRRLRQHDADGREVAVADIAAAAAADADAAAAAETAAETATAETAVTAAADAAAETAATAGTVAAGGTSDGASADQAATATADPAAAQDADPAAVTANPAAVDGGSGDGGAEGGVDGSAGATAADGTSARDPEPSGDGRDANDSAVSAASDDPAGVGGGSDAAADAAPSPPPPAPSGPPAPSAPPAPSTPPPPAPKPVLPLLGLMRHGAGRIALYGDSSCVDGSHPRADCFALLDAMTRYALGTSDALERAGTRLPEGLDLGLRPAKRRSDVALEPISNILGKPLECSRLSPRQLQGRDFRGRPTEEGEGEGSAAGGTAGGGGPAAAGPPGTASRGAEAPAPPTPQPPVEPALPPPNPPEPAPPPPPLERAATSEGDPGQPAEGGDAASEGGTTSASSTAAAAAAGSVPDDPASAAAAGEDSSASATAAAAAAAGRGDGDGGVAARAAAEGSNFPGLVRAAGAPVMHGLGLATLLLGILGAALLVIPLARRRRTGGRATQLSGRRGRAGGVLPS